MSSKAYELTSTSNVTASNIISIEIIIKMIFFRFRMNPRIPIKNRINDKFMIVYLILMDQCINIVNYVTVKKSSTLVPLTLKSSIFLVGAKLHLQIYKLLIFRTNISSLLYYIDNDSIQ